LKRSNRILVRLFGTEQYYEESTTEKSKLKIRMNRNGNTRNVFRYPGLVAVIMITLCLPARGTQFYMTAKLERTTHILPLQLCEERVRQQELKCYRDIHGPLSCASEHGEERASFP